MTHNKSVSALRAKRNGQAFENYIERTCTHYRTKRIAAIYKTPEPLKAFAVLNKQRGWYKAYYEKKGEPDFHGTLKGGQSFLMEAKHTDTTNMPFDRIARQQEEALQIQHDLGGVALILISFNMKRFYCIRWSDWKHLKDNIDKKSVNEKNLAIHEVQLHNGLIDFLKEYSG